MGKSREKKKRKKKRQQFIVTLFAEYTHGLNLREKPKMLYLKYWYLSFPQLQMISIYSSIHYMVFNNKF